MEFDHLGVVIKNLARARGRLASILKIEQWTREIDDPVNGVRLQFGRDAAGVCYELLEPLGPESPVASALANGQAILNHVAYRVTDLAASREHFEATGCAPTSAPKPAIAYGGRPIQFFVTPLRFIIELIEAPGHQHAFEALSFSSVAAAASVEKA